MWFILAWSGVQNPVNFVAYFGLFLFNESDGSYSIVNAATEFRMNAHSSVFLWQVPKKETSLSEVSGKKGPFDGFISAPFGSVENYKYLPPLQI